MFQNCTDANWDFDGANHKNKVQIYQNKGIKFDTFRVKYEHKPHNINIFKESNMKETKILIAEYIALLKVRTGITSSEVIAQMSNVAEGTVKNLSSAKSDNPGIASVAPVIYALGGSIDEMFNQGKVKEEINEVSFISIKEICENQLNAMKKSYDEQINNIRSHYEQHRQDVTENFERRLADKREIIEMQKAEHKTSKIVAWVLGAILIALLIAEVMNPNLGWLRY